MISAEAGAIFGAHGIGYETIMRNLALLNVLWDGGEIAVDRRLTLGLMVQPKALRGFLERAATLPRASSFIARLLIAWPASTQGTRSYRLAPDSMPTVKAVRTAYPGAAGHATDHACRWWAAADRAGAVATRACSVGAGT